MFAYDIYTDLSIEAFARIEMKTFDLAAVTDRTHSVMEEFKKQV